MVETIGSEDIAGMISAAAKAIRAGADRLSKLDSAVGDGDHGTSMCRAMDAAAAAAGQAAGGVTEMLRAVGWAVMGIDGGSTGPLFGSFFAGMGAAAAGDTLDCAATAGMFTAGLAGMQKHTKARVGDKTVIDALTPAIEALQVAAAGGASIDEAMEQAADAAESGAAGTKDMQAKFGRARNLGERTIGHVDPGAASAACMFRAFADALADHQGNQQRKEHT